jgi:MSHA pilin protein MshD
VIVRPRQRGFTLVEVVVSIVILAIAVAGVVAGLSATAVRSANAMISEQATVIATSYLNEVMQKPFGVIDGKIARSALDVVDDYGGLTDVGAHDQSGTAIPALSQFTIQVRVSPVTLGTIPTTQARQVDVIVTHSSGTTVVLSGYRTQYP